MDWKPKPYDIAGQQLWQLLDFAVRLVAALVERSLVEVHQ